MAKKGGLGKGLDALFSTSVIEETDENEVIHNLKISEVEPNKDQPRRIFEQDALKELSESIKKYGVIQPIIVSKKDDIYQIVAGERRWRASKIAGLTEIPAIIRENDEQKNKEIALIENIQREDLNPIEKARGIKELMTDYNLTQQMVADKLGKSRSSIANTVRILNLDDRVIQFALDGKLTEGHCKALLAIQDPEEQIKTALRIVENGDTVRVVEKKAQHKKNNSKVARKYEYVYKDIEDTFQGFFGTKVKVDAGKRSGKIIINYTNNDDLERILSLIKN